MRPRRAGGDDSPQRINIQEVAAAAGVSTAAVSLVLNGKGRISEETRKRVLAVASELGYTPNAAAIALATGRSRVLALAFSRAWEVPYPLTEIDYFDRAIRAATGRALERDYALILGPPNLQTNFLSRTPLDGLILLDPVLDEPLIRDHGGHPPLITVGRAEASDRVAGYIDNDHHEGTRLAMDHLVGAGGSTPALLAADLRDSYTRDCLEGYKAWCEAKGQRPLAQTVVPRDTEEVFEALDAFARRTDSGPPAVYANDDLLARQSVVWAKARGRTIPADFLLVAGTDRTDFSEIGVDLTSLEVEAEALAEAAVDLLVDLLEDEEPTERGRILPTRLRPRASTAP